MLNQFWEVSCSCSQVGSGNIEEVIKAEQLISLNYVKPQELV
jgi:hypothetical protein